MLSNGSGAWTPIRAKWVRPASMSLKTRSFQGTTSIRTDGAAPAMRSSNVGMRTDAAKSVVAMQSRSVLVAGSNRLHAPPRPNAVAELAGRRATDRREGCVRMRRRSGREVRRQVRFGGVLVLDSSPTGSCRSGVQHASRGARQGAHRAAKRGLGLAFGYAEMAWSSSQTCIPRKVCLRLSLGKRPLSDAVATTLIVESCSDDESPGPYRCGSALKCVLHGAARRHDARCRHAELKP